MMNPSERPGVLIVEDDPDIAESLGIALRFEGYSVDVATNGKEALDYLRCGALPGLIILDITMPVMDGAEFLTRRKEIGSGSAVPVILMSAANDRVRQGVLLEVCDHIRKPMDVSALLETVSRHMRPAFLPNTQPAPTSGNKPIP